MSVVNLNGRKNMTHNWGERSIVGTHGRFDNLSGIYCLYNAIRHWENFEQPSDRDAFRYLLEAAHRLNLFHVFKVFNGYEDHEMVDIFNEFARAHCYPAKALSLAAIRNSLPDWSFTVQAKRIFEQGGQIVTSVDAGQRWVLAFQFDYDEQLILVEDPDPDGGHVSIVGQQAGRQGVVILPNSAALCFSN